MSTIVKFLSSFLLIVLTNSCKSNFSFNGITGTGPVKTRTVSDLSSFSSIEASRGLSVILKQDSENKAIITTNENLLDIIDVHVEGNTLIISSIENIVNATKREVLVHFESINSLSVSSGTSIKTEGQIKERDLDFKASSGSNSSLDISADILTCSTSSGSNVKLTGYANVLDITSSSGSSFSATDMEAYEVKANSSSGSNIKVQVKERITANASSGSSINYDGNPKETDISDSSGGSVRKM